MKGKYSVPLSKIIRSEQLTPVFLPKDPEDILIYSMEVNRPGLILARYDNNFMPERIELLGNSEYLYLRASTASCGNSRRPSSFPSTLPMNWHRNSCRSRRNMKSRF